MTSRRPPPSPFPQQESPRASLAMACALATSLALAGCVDLPLLQVNFCGNRVVEADAQPQEECDGQPGCGEPGSAHACRYVCGPDDPPCPGGFGCGVDSVCRRPSGQFKSIFGLSTVTTLDLLVGDTNADGCSELIHTTLHGSVVTSLQSHAPGFCAALEQVLPTVPLELGQEPYPSPLLADLTSNGRPELVVAGPALLSAGLSVYSPDNGPTLAPVLYPSGRQAEPSVRPIKVNVRGADVLLMFLGDDGPPMPGGESVRVAALVDPRLKPTDLYALEGHLGDIVALKAADLDGGPKSEKDRCDEVIVARGGEARVAIYRLCKPHVRAMTFTPVAEVELDGGARLRRHNAAIAVIDHNGDDKPDLLMNADDGNLHIAYGLGDGRFQATLPLVMGSPDQRTSALTISDPALQAQIKDPGSTFVTGHFDAAKGVTIAAVTCPSGALFQSPVCAPIAGDCEAVVADIDGDGLDDIVATEGQQPGLLLRKGTESGGFRASFFETQCPPHDLIADDLDGDGVADFAFFDQTPPQGGKVRQPMDEIATALKVAHGNRFAAPTPAEGEGRFNEALGLTSGHFVPQAPGQQLVAMRSLRGQGARSALALIEGESDRRLLAPFYFPAGRMGPDNLVAVELLATSAGRFATDLDGKIIPGLAVLTRNPGMMVTQRLWVLGADPFGGDLRAVKLDGATPLACDACVLSPVDVDADGRDELMLLGDHEIIVYTAALGGFIERARFASDHAFRRLDDAVNPTKHVARPRVADLDGDGFQDVVARSTSGALVALWGRAGGGFSETELVAAPICAGGSSCSGLSVALLNADADPDLEVAVIGPVHTDIYNLDRASRSLVPTSTSLMPDRPTEPADFTALAVADFDGDGVDDLAVMASSSFINIFRGIPALE